MAGLLKAVNGAAAMDTLRSALHKLMGGKTSELTQDEKVHLGVVAGVVTLTSVVLATVVYKNNTSSKKPNKSAEDYAAVKDPESLSRAAVATPSTHASTHKHNPTPPSTSTTTDEEFRLAASPSSEEDVAPTATATPPTTTTTAALEVERRIQAEFDAPTSSTTDSSDKHGDGSEDYSSEEEEDEQRQLELEDAIKLMQELLDALDKFHDDRMVEVYGSFVSCLISMQKVFQRFDWGYAEWPDVVAVLDVHTGDPEYDQVWHQLQLKLTSLHFPNIPIFKDDLSREELLKVMGEMLAASKQVAGSVRDLKTTGDPIIDAHHNFNEQKNRESYEQWRRLCSKEEFAEISNAAIFPNDTEVRVPKHVLKAWKDNYLVRVMLNMMTPLTKLQEDNMRKYGIGATHFQQQVWKYGGDPEVAEVKHQLEYMMTQIHPTASDTETSNSGSGSSSGGEDSLY